MNAPPQKRNPAPGSNGAGKTDTHILPHSTEAEQGLVAAILADAPSAMSALAQTHPDALEYFYDFRHREICAAVRHLVANGITVEPVSLCGQLEATPEARAYIAALQGQAFSADLAGHYAAILRSLYVRRRQIEAAARIDRAARTGDEAGAAEALRMLSEVGEEKPLYQIEALLSEREFDPNYTPQLLQAVFSCAGVPICTRDNLTAITAAPKVGKSAIIGGMIAATMAIAGSDTLGFTATNPEGRAVIHFDTEQAKDDHATNIWRAIRRAGREVRPDWLKSYFVSGFTVKQLQSALWDEAERQAKNFGGIHSIFIDGVADMVNDVNDPDESNAWVRDLHGGAIKFNCPIISVIHLNPGSDSKSRGHLGSQLERKSETNLKLEKDGEVTEVWSDKQRRAPILKGMGQRFRWSNEAGMHVSVAAAPTAKQTADKQDAIFLRDEVFADAKSLRYSELEKRVQEVTKKSAATSQRIFKKWVHLGVIEKGFGGTWIPTV